MGALVLSIVSSMLSSAYDSAELSSATGGPAASPGLVVAGVITTIALVLYLGPLGIATGLLIAAPLGLLFVGSGGASGVVGVILSTGVAGLNVLIVASWRERLRLRAARDAAPDPIAHAWRPPVHSPRVLGETPIVWADLRPAPWKQAVGAAAFALAGCGFVVLCFVCGFTAVVAHGVDVQIPDAQANHTLLLAALAWWPGLGVAIAGLVVWVRRGRRGEALLPWGLAGLGLQLGFVCLGLVGAASV